MAFERILHEGLEIHEIELFSYQLMTNHYHLILRPLVDGEMSRFMGWIGGTHTMRFHVGEEGRVEAIARRLNLESTIRPRGRARVRFPEEGTKQRGLPPLFLRWFRYGNSE